MIHLGQTILSVPEGTLVPVTHRLYLSPRKSGYLIEILVFGAPPRHPWSARISTGKKRDNICLKQGIAWLSAGAAAPPSSRAPSRGGRSNGTDCGSIPAPKKINKHVDGGVSSSSPFSALAKTTYVFSAGDAAVAELTVPRIFSPSSSSSKTSAGGGPSRGAPPAPITANDFTVCPNFWTLNQVSYTGFETEVPTEQEEDPHEDYNPVEVHVSKNVRRSLMCAMADLVQRTSGFRRSQQVVYSYGSGRMSTASSNSGGPTGPKRRPSVVLSQMFEALHRTGALWRENFRNRFLRFPAPGSVVRKVRENRRNSTTYLVNGEHITVLRAEDDFVHGDRLEDEDEEASDHSGGAEELDAGATGGSGGGSGTTLRDEEDTTLRGSGITKKSVRFVEDLEQEDCSCESPKRTSSVAEKILGSFYPSLLVQKNRVAPAEPVAPATVFRVERSKSSSGAARRPSTASDRGSFFVEVEGRGASLHSLESIGEVLSSEEGTPVGGGDHSGQEPPCGLGLDEVHCGKSTGVHHHA